MSSAPHQQHIRSFVRRAGRQTRAQDRAIKTLWPRFGVPALDPVASPLLDLAALFGRSAPCVLEIGFGNGDALVRMAGSSPDRNFLGVEVHAPGVGHCLLDLERLGLTNVRLLMEDAMEVLRERLPHHSLLGVHLFFPDPWQEAPPQTAAGAAGVRCTALGPDRARRLLPRGHGLAGLRGAH